MTILDMLAMIASGLLALAALSLIVNPQAHTSDIIKDLTNGFAKNIETAKAF